MVFVFICKKEGSTWKAHCTTDEGVEAEASTFSGLEEELKEAVRKEANFNGTLAINQTLVTPNKGIFVAQLGANIVPVCADPEK